MLRLSLILIVLVILIPYSVAQIETAYVDPEIEDALEEGNVQVIVILKNEAPRGLSVASVQSKKDRIKDVQEKVIKNLKKKGPGIAEEKRIRRLEHSPVITTVIDADDLAVLENDPNVEAIYINKIYEVTLATTVGLVNAPEVWGEKVNGFNLTGQGQSICVIDTGIDPAHGTFSGKIIDQKCYCQIATDTDAGCCQTAVESTNATDNNNHGTHVASIAVGNGSSVFGVAPGADIVAVKVCNSTGSCSLADLALAFDYCTNKSAELNISVMTASIADGNAYATQAACPTTMDAVIDAGVAAGMLVTIASGNQNSLTGVGHPACEDNATSVGGTTHDGNSIGSYTNRGPLLDVVAPGSSVVAALLGGGTTTKTGTSMAAPHVAGVAALLKQHAVLKGIAFDPEEIERILEETAVNSESFRRVDAISALVKIQSNYTFNATNNSLSQPTVGRVMFKGTVITSRLGDCFNITAGNITLDETNVNCTQYNVSSTVRLEGLSFHDAKPLLNGQPCSSVECQNITFGTGTLNFDAVHFSSYTAGSAVNLSITDDTDNESSFVFEQVIFFANFTNSTGPANNTDGACQIAINSTGTYGSFTDMTFNSSLNQFTYNQSFTDDLNGTFNVTCGSFGETLFTFDEFEIKNDTISPIVILNSPFNNSVQNISQVAKFAFNMTDNSSISSCQLFLNGTLNSTDTSIDKGINQTFNVTLSRGLISWNVTCTDSAGNNATSGTFVFTMNATNQAPVVIANISNQSWPEDTNINISLASIFNDTDGDALTYTATASPNVSVYIDNSTENATFLPLANFSGLASVVFTAWDPLNVNVSSNNVSLNVTFVDDAPSLQSNIPDESWDEGTDNNNAFDLDTFFSDSDNVTLNYTSNGTSSITVSIASDGQVSFTQGSSFDGTETVTFNASDGTNGKLSNAVMLTVNAVSSGGGGGGGGGGGAGCTSTCSPVGFTGCSGNNAIRCQDTNGDGCYTSTLTICASDETCSTADEGCVGATCYEEWFCDDWSECSAGLQFRSCLEGNECGTEDNKPAEDQECTMPVDTILQIQDTEPEPEVQTDPAEEAPPDEPPEEEDDEGLTIPLAARIAAASLIGGAMLAYVFFRHRTFVKGKSAASIKNAVVKAVKGTGKPGHGASKAHKEAMKKIKK